MCIILTAFQPVARVPSPPLNQTSETAVLPRLDHLLLHVVGSETSASPWQRATRLELPSPQPVYAKPSPHLDTDKHVLTVFESVEKNTIISSPSGCEISLGTRLGARCRVPSVYVAS